GLVVPHQGADVLNVGHPVSVAVARGQALAGVPLIERAGVTEVAQPVTVDVRLNPEVHGADGVEDRRAVVLRIGHAVAVAIPLGGDAAVDRGPEGRRRPRGVGRDAGGQTGRLVLR